MSDDTPVAMTRLQFNDKDIIAIMHMIDSFIIMIEFPLISQIQGGCTKNSSKQFQTNRIFKNIITER
jgi:hypothetical protein